MLWDLGTEQQNAPKATSATTNNEVETKQKSEAVM
jgi:hypothetical protein